MFFVVLFINVLEKNQVETSGKVVSFYVAAALLLCILFAILLYYKIPIFS